MSAHLPRRDSHWFPPSSSLSLSLSVPFRVFSQRTKRSSSTTPSWLCYLRRLSCRLSMPSWRAISRPSDAWWPPRLASRLSPSSLSKDAADTLLHLLALFLSKSTYVELLITGMLCHSKVWSRVWTHRCNVNMNPYISVCPLSVCISYPSCSFPESVWAVYWSDLSSFIFALLSSQAF